MQKLKAMGMELETDWNLEKNTAYESKDEVWEMQQQKMNYVNSRDDFHVDLELALLARNMSQASYCSADYQRAWNTTLCTSTLP
ncbi:hypothetical protein SARC_16840, partial [Sphaeroforma arctica JP610]